MVTVYHLVNRRNGLLLKENLLQVKNGDLAVVKMIPNGEVCLESFADYPNLGKIVIRLDKGRIAHGIILNVEKKKTQDQGISKKKK